MWSQPIFQVFLIIVWNFELYMLPITLLIIFLKNLLVVHIVGNLMKDRDEDVSWHMEVATALRILFWMWLSFIFQFIQYPKKKIKLKIKVKADRSFLDMYTYWAQPFSPFRNM